MTVDVATITRERLAEWQKGCVEAHATPALLLTIGHDDVSGEAHLFVPDVFDNEDILKLLYLCIRELRVP